MSGETDFSTESTSRQALMPPQWHERPHPGKEAWHDARYKNRIYRIALRRFT